MQMKCGETVFTYSVFKHSFHSEKCTYSCVGIVCKIRMMSVVLFLEYEIRPRLGMCRNTKVLKTSFIVMYF
jgi:hypothetical protein